MLAAQPNNISFGNENKTTEWKKCGFCIRLVILVDMNKCLSPLNSFCERNYPLCQQEWISSS